MTLETKDAAAESNGNHTEMAGHVESLIDEPPRNSDNATQESSGNENGNENGNNEQVLNEGRKFEFISIDEFENVTEKIKGLSNHYRIPDILIKSLFDLNNKKKRLYPVNDINNNSAIITTPLGDDDNVCKFLLSLEAEIIAFIVKPNIDSLKMRPLNSYYRLLAHQLAEYYHLGHILSNDGSSMVLFKINTSLINADDETKKSASFDNSGNIKPLDFRNLKFDPNEKLDRVKLIDLYNHYKHDFDKSKSGDNIVNNFQNLTINDNVSNDIPHMNTSNLRIMKRKEDVLPVSEAKSEKSATPVDTNEDKLTKEERYRLAKEQIDRENQDENDDYEEGDDETEIIINQDENGGNLVKENQSKYHSNDNNSHSYTPEGSNGYSGNYSYNNYNNNNSNKGRYNRRGSDYNNNGYKKGRNYGRNSNLNNKNMMYNNNGNPNYNYGYNYGYYPNNQLYQYNNPPSTSYGYMMAPPVHIPSNNTPMTSPVMGSPGYYYVPVIPPTENIDNRINDGSPKDTTTDDNNSHTGSNSPTNRGSSKSPSYGTPLNAGDSPIVSSQHALPIPTIPIPVSPTPIIQPQYSPNGRPVYQYYYPPPPPPANSNTSSSNSSRNGNQYYGNSSPPGSNHMVFYADGANNGYVMGNNRNNKYNNNNGYNDYGNKRSGKGYVRRNDKVHNAQSQSQSDDVVEKVPDEKSS